MAFGDRQWHHTKPKRSVVVGLQHNPFPKALDKQYIRGFRTCPFALCACNFVQPSKLLLWAKAFFTSDQLW